MFAMEWARRMRIGMVERAVQQLSTLANRCHPNATPAHLVLGLAGEDAAFFHLRRKGYTIVARRWSSGDLPGDIDLIGWLGDLLCFFEIKTRATHDATPAEVAVDSHKRTILRRLARRYIRQLPQAQQPQVRFDVISVYLIPRKDAEILHFENAFGWSEWREQR